VALFARGLAESRAYDSVGVGWYMNGISPELQNQVRTYTRGAINVQNEQGLEMFYDYAPRRPSGSFPAASTSGTHSPPSPQATTTPTSG
jgi:hypothetical protein